MKFIVESVTSFLSSWLTSSCQQITRVIMHRWMGEERNKKSNVSVGIVTISHVAPLSHLAEWNAEARGGARLAARSQTLTGRCGGGGN